MRKVLISIAAIGTALAFATPAAAQYHPQDRPGYGYNNGWGQTRELQARIDRIQDQIRRLDRRDAIGNRSADRLQYEARRIEDRLHRIARNGLNPNEANEIQARIANLEQRVHYAVGNGNGHHGYGDRDDRRDHN